MMINFPVPLWVNIPVLSKLLSLHNSYILETFIKNQLTMCGFISGLFILFHGWTCSDNFRLANHVFALPFPASNQDTQTGRQNTMSSGFSDDSVTLTSAVCLDSHTEPRSVCHPSGL